MKRASRILLLFTLNLGLLIPVVQGDSADRDQVSEPIYFRIGQSGVDPGFMGNGPRLDRFVASLRTILSDSNYVVSRVVVAGTASPDGDEQRNLSLAGSRAQSLADYLVKHTGLSPDKIEVVNRGENWSGLRAMIESSTMPYKEEMLDFMDTYPDNRDRRKHKMQYYAESKPWLWMYEHFFPILRTGAGGTQAHERLSELSMGNWERIRHIVLDADIEEELRRALLDILDDPDASSRLERLQSVCPADLYARIQEQALRCFLEETSLLSDDNWSALRDMVASSEMAYRDEVLEIIDRIPIAAGREARLRALRDGEPYRYMVEHFFPRLLISDRPTRLETLHGAGEAATLSAENWRRLRAMIAASEMPDRAQVLVLIDGEEDLVVRGQQLREMNGGETYRYVSEVFFPELLYGVSPATRENWKLLASAVAKSDLPNRDRILEIIATTAPGAERAQAIRSLDDGRSWEHIRTVLLPELLLDMEAGDDLGSGMSFYYEPSPAAKARAEELERQAEDKRRAERQRAEEQRRRVEAARLAAEQARAQAEAERARQEAAAQLRMERKEHLGMKPLIGVKTDLMMWGSLMPGFQIGTSTPNLSAELYFADRWSAQVGWAYADWNGFSGSDGLFASSTLDLEARYWFGADEGLFRGLFAGVYGSYGDYDVQAAKEATGQTGTFFAVGAGVGWAFPVSRHLGFEAQLRGGYRSASNELYDIETGHYYLDRKKSQGAFAPQLRVQFVYRFGDGRK